MKRIFLIPLTALVATFATAAERNIIFIITDDQSPTLGCYGDKTAYSPAVDSLAQDGVVFRNAYATTASCSASRSVVLSGLHNHRNGQFGHHHGYHGFAAFKNVISLSISRALANEGYRTGHIGKYHVAPEEVYHFENYFGGGGRNPVAMANDVEAFIKEENEKPFFLYYATNDPHRGPEDNQNYSGELKPNLFGNKADRGEYPGIKEKFFHPENIPVPPYLPDTPETRSELAEYYQSCARIDQGVGRLIEILKEADLYDKTLIVFTSDHGMAFAGAKTTVFEAGLNVPFVVRDPYQKKRGLTTNAMISHIDIAPSLLDFAGGLNIERNRPKKWINPNDYWKGKEYVKKENLGFKAYDQYHGKSWLPVLSKPKSAHHKEAYASHTFHEITMYYPMRAVWDGKYKLIWNIAHQLPYPFASDLWASSTWQAQLAKGDDALYGQQTVGGYVNRPQFELYDVSKNRYEKTNLAEDPEFAKVLEAYKAKLKAFQVESKDPWLLKWDYE